MPSYLLRLMLENRFPRIWVPDAENRDLRQLLWHRHRLVQMSEKWRPSMSAYGSVLQNVLDTAALLEIAIYHQLRSTHASKALSIAALVILSWLLHSILLTNFSEWLTIIN